MPDLLTKTESTGDKIFTYSVVFFIVLFTIAMVGGVILYIKDPSVIIKPPTPASSAASSVRPPASAPASDVEVLPKPNAEVLPAPEELPKPNADDRQQ